MDKNLNDKRLIFKKLLKKNSVYFTLLKNLKNYYKNKYNTLKEENNEKAYLYLAALESIKAFFKGEIPIGCILVSPDGKIFKAHNLKETLKDPTAHAEILAIRKASNFYNSWYLEDYKIFITLEPCLMCFGTMLESRIKYIVYGYPENKYGYSNYVKENFLSSLKITVKNYILSDIIIPIKIFFKLLRKKDNFIL